MLADAGGPMPPSRSLGTDPSDIETAIELVALPAIEVSEVPESVGDRSVEEGPSPPVSPVFAPLQPAAAKAAQEHSTPRHPKPRRAPSSWRTTRRGRWTPRIMVPP